MSDQVPSVLSPEKLTALDAAGDPETIGGIAAIEARVLYGISSFVSLLTNHLGALAGTQPDGTALGLSIYPKSVTAVGSAVSQAIQPQFSQHSKLIKDVSDRLDKATAQIAENERQISTRFDVQEIRTDLVALIETEFGRRWQELATGLADLLSRYEECEKTVRQLTSTPTRPPSNRRVQEL